MDGLRSSPVAGFLEHILCNRKEGLEMLGRLVSSRGSVEGKEGTEAGLWPVAFQLPHCAALGSTDLF